MMIKKKGKQPKELKVIASAKGSREIKFFFLKTYNKLHSPYRDAVFWNVFGHSTSRFIVTENFSKMSLQSSNL